jgi:aminomuconate-semialdehyde/2-hydroxymuconate-6-semialdehyde dehydrogenase
MNSPYRLSNYLDGALVPPRNGRYLEVFEPAVGAVYAHCPDSGVDDVSEAVAAAERAFPAWSRLSGEERGDWLARLADAVEARFADFAMAESRDTGKPLTLARTLDIPRALRNLRFFAAAASQFASESHATAATLDYTLRQPLGVVGCIAPWNLPLYLLTWKVAPALAAGNTVVAKPSELTPFSANLFAEACRAAGLPAGVLNLVHGQGVTAGQALIEQPKIRAISFTGSTRTGAVIAAAAAPQFKKLSLELGGKNPTVVFADWPASESNWDVLLRSAFANQGQICLCGSRLLVERRIYPEFKRAFVERAHRLRVGDPLEATSDLGAVVSAGHLEKILGYIALAEREGGRVLCGGEALRLPGRCANGWFVAPTVIEGLDPTCRTNQEEIFGPVVTLIPFDTEDEAIAIANGTPYGLAASVWTSTLARAHRLAARLDVGIVWINCWMRRDLRTPFGGMKQSGVGREGGFEALRFFTEAKNVCLALE